MSVPTEILNGSSSEKLAYFSTIKPQHPALIRVVSRLKLVLNSIDDAPIVLLIGPTGVGKSSLIEAYIGALIRKIDPQRHHISAFSVEAQEATPNGFDWSYFYGDCLHKLQEVCIECTLSVRKVIAAETELIVPDYRRSRSTPTADDLMRRLKETLVNRETVLFAVDEAYHILQASYSGQKTAAADVLRSIVSGLVTKLVLVGAFDLFEVATRSAQLSRRCEIVPFMPYSPSPEGKKEFLALLQELQKNLPLETPPDLSDFLEELLAASCGCAGLLKRILTRSLALALEKKTPVTKSILRASYFRKAQHEQFIKEINDGAIRLGYQKIWIPKQDIQTCSVSPVTKRRVGQRNLGRDSVIV